MHADTIVKGGRDKSRATDLDTTTQPPQPHNQPHNHHKSMAQKRASTGSGAMPTLSDSAIKSLLQSNDDLAKVACETLSDFTAAKQMELGYNVVKGHKMQKLVSVLLENSNGNDNESSAKKITSAIDDAKILRNPFVLKRQFDSLQVQRHYYSNDQLPNDRVFKYVGHSAFAHYTEQIDGHTIKYWKYNGSPQAIQHVKKYCLEELKVGQQFMKSFGNEFYCAFVQKNFPLSMLEEDAVDVDDDY